MVIIQKHPILPVLPHTSQFFANKFWSETFYVPTLSNEDNVYFKPASKFKIALKLKCYHKPNRSQDERNTVDFRSSPN